MRVHMLTPTPKVPARALAQVCALLDRQRGKATGKQIRAALAAGGFREPVQIGRVLGEIPRSRRSRRGLSSASLRQLEALPSGWPLPERFKPFVDFVLERFGIGRPPHIRMLWRSELGASAVAIFAPPDQIRIASGLSESGTQEAIAHELVHLRQVLEGSDFDESDAWAGAREMRTAWEARERPSVSTPAWGPAPTSGALGFASTLGPPAW